MIYFIYAITNTINNKKYIGCTMNIKSRWKYHQDRLNKNLHDNKYLQSDWTYFGKKNFILTIIIKTNNKNDEFLYINKFNTFYPNGYNMTYGGTGISGYKFTDESITNRSSAMTGKENSLYGKKMGKGSKYFGVYKHQKKNSKYIYYNAKITINKKSIWIGSFKNEIDAARAYDKYCWNIYSDKNHLNFPEELKNITV